MGVTLTWRELPERDAKNYGRQVELRAGRATAAAYLACSDRVGPGLLILSAQPHEDLEKLADAFCAAGFTVLAPELTDETSVAIAVAAAQHLRDNWHPRLGVLALGGTASLAFEIADRVTADGIVAVDESDALTELSCPVLITTEFETAVDFLTHHAS